MSPRERPALTADLVNRHGFVAPRSGYRVLEWLCCRAASGARAAGGPARRVGLPLATWDPVIAGTGTQRR